MKLKSWKVINNEQIHKINSDIADQYRKIGDNIIEEDCTVRLFSEKNVSKIYYICNFSNPRWHILLHIHVSALYGLIDYLIKYSRKKDFIARLILIILDSKFNKIFHH